MSLVYVLWGVGLLSTIAVSFLSASNISYRLSHNAFEIARTEAAAEAAITRAVLGLLDPRPERRWRVDGVPHDFTFGNRKMRIAIQDELGRIDLNIADQSLLIGLFQSAGLDFFAASSLVDKVLDWRDTSLGRRTHGAKEPEYRSAGFAYTPRNGPFQSVDELKLVMGITPELYRRVRPALTVYSGRQFLDPQFAPREALSALSSMNSDTVASTIAARASQGARAGIIDPAISLRGRAFTIRTEIEKADGALEREVVIRLTDHALQPHWLLSWRSK